MKTNMTWQPAAYDNNFQLPEVFNNYHPVLKKVLAQYHHQYPDESLTTYLAANITHNASDLHDIDKAWQRLAKAKANHEKVRVYGDYDVDGMTSTAIMYEGLKKYGLNVDYVIPNRLKDGYGPSKRLYQQMIDDNIDIVVTVDNGISGRDIIDTYHKLGLDVIITDHHEPNELTMPKTAVAIVHAMLSPDYNFDGLSGAGIAYKFITYQLPELAQSLLDLTAMGLIADVMPLVDENRQLVKNGLIQLSHSKRLGLESLKKAANINDNTITTTTVGFFLGPMLNSMGRLSDAKPAIEALVSQDESKVSKDVKIITDMNNHRKELSGELDKIAVVQGQRQNQHHDILLVGGNYQQWPQGIVGIVASRIVDTYHKPALSLSFNPDTQIVHGSARSLDGYSIYDALNYVNTQMGDEIFISMGGHAGAAGFAFKYDRMAELQHRLDYYTSKHPLPKYDPKLTISSSLTIPQATNIDFYNQLQTLAPFGQNNPEPIFHIRIKKIMYVNTMGLKKQHMKFVGYDNFGNRIDVLGFNKAIDLSKIQAIQQNNEFLDVAGTLSENEYKNNVNIQIVVKDWGQL